MTVMQFNVIPVHSLTEALGQLLLVFRHRLPRLHFCIPSVAPVRNNLAFTLDIFTDVSCDVSPFHSGHFKLLYDDNNDDDNADADVGDDD